MIERYTLPAVTIDGQDTSIGIVVDNDAKLREWVNCVKRFEAEHIFRFHWDMSPRATMHQLLLGAFCVLWYQDGIYIKMKLYHEEYRDVEYPLNDFCRMLFKSERPSLGWCITVTVQ